MASEIPDWDEYPKLKQLKVEPLLQQAEELTMEIKGLELRREELKLIIAGKMAAAEAQSIYHNGFTYVWKDGGPTVTRDKDWQDWAEKLLLQKGVPSKDIDRHKKQGTRKGSLTITAPKED